MGDIALSRTSGSAGVPGPTSLHPHGSRHATRPLQRQDGHRETRPDDTRPGPRPTRHSPAPRRSERLLVTKPHLSKVTSGAHPKRRAARSSERWRPNPRTWCVCSSGTAKMTRSREVTVTGGLWLWSSACVWAPSPSSLGSLPAGAGHTLLLVPHRRGRRPGGRRRAQAAPRPPGPPVWWILEHDGTEGSLSASPGDRARPRAPVQCAEALGQAATHRSPRRAGPGPAGLSPRPPLGSRGGRCS